MRCSKSRSSVRWYSGSLFPGSLLLLLTASVLGLAGCGLRPGLSRDLSTPALSTPDLPAASSPVAPSATPQSAQAVAEASVALGPRVAGTDAAEQANRYLKTAFQQLGYQVEVQPFTYEKFADRGSSLTVDGTPLAGRALNGSIPGNLTARLVAVPNAGRPEDFAQTDVRGAIALVRRGEIRFLEKANNAAAAGAVGLVIVNNQDDDFRGTLGGETTIPVLSLAGTQAATLSRAAAGAASVTLNVNTETETVTGRNLIAHLPGVAQPDLLLGVHFDSVADSPGANDNASGTAVLLDLARHLANSPNAEQVWFVAFDGEEDGLQGSRAFVEAAQPQFLSQLRAMLNFDMVGINRELQISGSDDLTRLAKSAAPPDVPQIAVIRETGGSDHAAFAAADVPVLFFTRGMEPNYHSPRDRQVDADLLNETTRISLTVLNRLLTP